MAGIHELPSPLGLNKGPGSGRVCRGKGQGLPSHFLPIPGPASSQEQLQGRPSFLPKEGLPGRPPLQTCSAHLICKGSPPVRSWGHQNLEC